MLLGELNWPEFKALDKSNLVGVYPIASFEQHGPHLPFLTDTIETTAIVQRLHERLPNGVVCLPTQWLGYSYHHTRFAGSITATSDTHINLMVETISCMINSGLPNVLVVNGHGGNRNDLSVALQKLKEEYEDDVRVYGASWWEGAAERLAEIKEAGPLGSGHAGEMETSLMLSIRPDLVRTDKLQKDGRRPDSKYHSKVMQYKRLDEVSDCGVWGDATYGAAEKGERMLQAIVDSLVEIVGDIQAGRLTA